MFKIYFVFPFDYMPPENLEFCRLFFSVYTSPSVSMSKRVSVRANALKRVRERERERDSEIE